MTASAMDPLRPRRPGGMGRGAMLALVVHVGLLIAIAFGVSWRSSEPAGVTAELWAAVPEQAAPAAVAPPPQPVMPKPEPKVEPPPPKPEVRDAEIALEKAKAAEKAREERERAEARKRAQDEAEKREREKTERAAKAAEKAEADKLAKVREEQMKRILGQAGATGAPQATGAAQRDAGPSASYAGRIIARVRPNIVLTETVPATLLASVELRVAPDGTITSRRLVKSSGNATWDEAVLRAIDKTETLPKDENGRVQSPMIIDFRPA
jgi:colicin import membrane protein